MFDLVLSVSKLPPTSRGFAKFGEWFAQMYDFKIMFTNTKATLN